MDVHWKTTTICILNEYGQQVKSKRIDSHWHNVLGFMAGIGEPFEVAFEASCGYGFLYDRLCKMARRVVVAHPGQLRLIFRAKRKNDRVDAEKLAKLLYLDEVPPAYVPSVEIRQWRELIEHRQAVVRRIVRCKNSMRALLRSQGIVSPRGLWTKAGVRWLEEVEMGEIYRVRLDMLLEELEVHNRHLERVTKMLDKIGRKSPAVTVLRTIPGVGPRTSEAMAAYIGDARRFSNNRALGAYLGLVPCQDASAGANRYGHITAEGPATARKLLVEASWQVIRRCPRTAARFERLCQGRKDRRKTAVVAIARHLACCMLSMLQTGEAWRGAA
jgi:transposase